MEETAIGLIILLWVVGVILAVLWTFLPFAVFGTKKRIDALTAEMRKANAALNALDRRAKEANRLASLGNDIAAAAGGVEVE